MQPLPLHAGTARSDITPTKPCFLVGYPHVERTSTGTHDPLFASALCLKNSECALLFISLDILFVTSDWVQECRRRISKLSPIPLAQILIAATHTHSGPLTAEILAWKDDPTVPPPDPAYIEFLCEAVCETALRAVKACIPAEIATVVADVRGIAGGNRIDPDGAEDPRAGMLFIRSEGSGEPIAILPVYGMHPTVLHEDSTHFSADFIAFTRSHLEGAFPGATVVYLNGVCGNQSPRRVVNAQTFAEAGRIGMALGIKMEDALRSSTHFQKCVPLASAVDHISICGRSFPTVEEARSRLDAARSRYAELKTRGAGHSEVRTAECTVFGAEEVLTLAKAEVSGDAESVRLKYNRAEVQAFRISDFYIAAWPGEFFVEYGLEVSRSGPEFTFVCTIANGELHGYVVTPEAEALGGYEAQMSLFPASTGSLFVECTLRLLRNLATGTTRSS